MGTLPMRILIKKDLSNEIFFKNFCKVQSNNRHVFTIKDVQFAYYAGECNPLDNVFFRDCSMMLKSMIYTEYNFRNVKEFCQLKRKREIERLKQLIKRTKEPMSANEREKLDFACQNGLIDNHIFIKFRNEIDDDDDRMLYLPL